MYRIALIEPSHKWSTSNLRIQRLVRLSDIGARVLPLFGEQCEFSANEYQLPTC